MSKQAAPKMLDLSQFASLDDAVQKVKPQELYKDVASLLADRATLDVTYPLLFWFAMITRAEGLHQSIAREIAHENPHAALPLTRAFAESVTLLIYVIDRPDYIDVLIDRPRNRPKGGPRRKTMQALIQHASKHAPGLKRVYDDLSEATHFGSIAMWMSMRLEDTKRTEDSIGTISWASAPRWRDENQALIVCAMTLELADAMDAYLREYAVVHLGVEPEQPSRASKRSAQSRV